MEKRVLGYGLIVFGIIFFIIGGLIPFYFTVMRLLIPYVILLSLGIIFLMLGIQFSLKEPKKIIGLTSLVSSLLTLFYLILWLWSLLNQWSYKINNSWLTPVFLGFFSISSGIIANKKVEKYDKFGLVGLIIAILSLVSTFAYILYLIFTTEPSY